jgi:hypothetical protein
MRSREDVIAKLREYDLKVFPLKDKRPDVEDSWKDIDENVPENKPFGVALGGINNIYVIDLDDSRLIPYCQTLIDKTYSVKTGKGVHIFIQGGKLCPKNTGFDTKYGHIDIKSRDGYVCGETSDHYNKKKDENGNDVYFLSGKKYELYPDSTLEINYIDPKEIGKIYDSFGVQHSKNNPINPKKESIKTRNLKALENGVKTGNRNTELFALSCNNLKQGVSPETAYDIVCYMNEKSTEPLSKEELDQLFQSAAAQVQEDIEESNTVHKIDDKTTYRLTDEEQIALRPITSLPDEQFILVYLNTDVELAERQIETLPMAYFVVNGVNGKSIVSVDNPKLQKKYDCNVFKSFKSLVGRWNNADVQAWLASDTKVNPKKLFDDLHSLERMYFENPYDYDYFYEAIWKVHTYFYTLFPLTPYNDYTGMKNIGKTKRLTLNKFICYNSWSSDDSSSSSLFRTTEGTGATMLLDEVEDLGNGKGDNADLQTILRGGNQKDHYVTRAVEVRGEWIPKEFDLFTPKAFGHIKPIDNVLQDRCITTKLFRSTNKVIANSEPEMEINPLIYSCRERCYRLFLDYAPEIKSLIPEAKELFTDVSGREMKLWLPLVTIGLFFEKHGVVGLVDKLMAKLTVNSEEKKVKDIDENEEVKILSTLLQREPENIPEQSRELYNMINDGLTRIYNLEPVNDVKLCHYLENLGFTHRRSSGHTKWININAVKISEAKERCGMVKATQATLGDNVSSVGSVS